MSVNTYIRENKFFNTGPLRKDMPVLRAEQNLPSLQISNVCNSNSLLYPARVVPLPKYGGLHIDNPNPCMKYIQPP